MHSGIMGGLGGWRAERARRGVRNMRLCYFAGTEHQLMMLRLHMLDTDGRGRREGRAQRRMGLVWGPAWRACHLSGVRNRHGPLPTPIPPNVPIGPSSHQNIHLTNLIKPILSITIAAGAPHRDRQLTRHGAPV